MRNILYILFTTCLSSCVVYPTMTTIPLTEDKDDINMNIGTSTTPISLNSTVSYGISNVFSGQTSGILTLENGWYIQQSLGVYKKFENNWVFENYYGVGNGYGKALFSTDGTSSNGYYQNYFTQINYGKVKTSIEYGFGLKMGNMHSYFSEYVYSETLHSYTNEDGSYMTTYYDIIKYHKNTLFFEPQLFLRWGGKFKYCFQVEGLYLYEQTKTTKNIRYSPINIGFGIQYNINNK